MLCWRRCLLLRGCVAAGVAIKSIYGVGGEKVEHKDNKLGYGSSVRSASTSSARRCVVSRCRGREDAHIVCTPTAGTVFTVLFKVASWNAFDEYPVLFWCI